MDKILSSLLRGFLVLLAVLSFQIVQAQVIINEVMPSNSVTLLDEDGESPDWIELLNLSDQAVNLENFSISDDKSDPQKFLLPNYTLDPGGFFLVYASGKNRSGAKIFWETIIREGDATRFKIGDASISNNWNTTAYNDAGWSDGSFGIGYGDNDDATQVPSGTISVFTRTSFTINSLSEVEQLLLHIDFDDGYVAYLNGVEIHRENISGDAPIPYDKLTNNYTEPRLIYGNPLNAINVTDFKDALVEGENVLAIQVHNSGPNSSDITLIPFLSVGFNTPRTNGRGVAAPTQLDESNQFYPHANFKISAIGETVYLLSANELSNDSLKVPQLFVDESYGRLPGFADSSNIFVEATPLAPNTTQGYLGRSANPDLSLPGGFYPNTIDLSLSNPAAGSFTYFTVDGSTPTESSEAFGSNSRQIAQTSTLKLRIIEPGKLPSVVVVESYFINETHDLPVVTVSTQPDNLWSDESGIYVRGTNGISGNCEGPVNWNQDWEIPIHIELYEKDGTKAFALGAGAKIFGGCSRSYPAKSLAIFFRSEYGSSSLKYKMFEGKDIEEFQAIVLRNSGNDFTSQGHSMIRDGMMTNLIKDTEVELQAYRQAVLYLNGEYWGIHNIREKVNEHFIASNSGADANNIDVLEGDGWEIQGTREKYDELLNYLSTNDLSDSAAYMGVEELIDINSYVDYMASQIYFANTDWPGNNIKFWRERSQEGKFRWIIYDTDFGFNLSYGGNTEHNTLNFALEPNGPGWPNPPWSTYILRQMVNSPIFVNKFANRMADLMNTVFKPDYVAAMIDSLAANIRSEIPRHMANNQRGQSWGGSVSGWEDELEEMKQFGNGRPDMMESFFTTPLQEGGKLGLQPLRILGVNVSDVTMGVVQVNRMIPETFPWWGEYFDGLKVPVTAIAKPGYVFTGWSGGVISNSRTINITSGQQVTANFEISTGGTGITINEIMYNSSEALETGDWVELYNPTSAAIDISGWVLKDENDTNAFIFETGTVLDSGSYLVVAQQPNIFNEVYPQEIAAIGPMGFGLAGSSDQVRLFDSNGATVDSLQYNDETPWPDGADGTGYSIELIEAARDNSKPESWRTSIYKLGSPGADNGTQVSEEPVDNLPIQIELFQNYPNPFNPVTSIRFNISKLARVQLTVFDVLGKKVATLENRDYLPGTYSLSWNAEGHASGVYVYRLEAEGQVLTKKMLLLK